ncbi:MAG: SdrD B-like domain-containing protein [Ilumatobacteraceae bacterium]
MTGSSTASTDAVGTTALGDLQLSPDGTTLWVVNMNDRQLYPIDVATATVGSPVAIPLATGASGACAAGDVRPMGLGVLADDLLVGSVCSGPTAAALRVYVYAFDPVARTFGAAPAFEAGLGFTRGAPGNGCGPNGGAGTWNPWLTTNPFDGSSSPTYCAYTQPMLSDIEVDDDGSLILGMRDRFGDQAGEDVPAGTFGGGGEGVSGGDTLRACPAVGGGWTLENDGVCGGVTSQSVGTNQGPGGREFYADGFATTTGPGSNHQEISVGGLAKVPGFTDVVHTVFDPNTSNGNDWRSGGLRKLSNTTGRVTGFFQLFDKCDSSGVNCPGSRTATLTFGKVNGIGDVVALCDMAPVEIGNRVWSDENGNGVQDPGEPAIAGVPVSLEIGSTTYTVVTDMNGVYRFSSDTRWSDTASAEFGVPQMSDGAAAVVTFPTAVTLSGVSRPITRRDAAGPNDQIDSDADELTGEVSLTIGGPGQNDHRYDAGYAARYSVGDHVWDDRDNDGVFQVGEPGIDGVTVRLYDDVDDNGIPDGPARADTDHVRRWRIPVHRSPTGHLRGGGVDPVGLPLEHRCQRLDHRPVRGDRGARRRCSPGGWRRQRLGHGRIRRDRAVEAGDARRVRAHR